MTIDAHTVGNIIAIVAGVLAIVRTEMSRFTVAAQLRACSELDAKVQGYIAGRAEYAAGRITKSRKGKRS